MKKIYLILGMICLGYESIAQQNTEVKDSSYTVADTLKVGSFIIIKKNKSRVEDAASSIIKIERKPEKPGFIKTNWFILDLGFANTRDKTNYSTLTGDYLRSSLTKDDFKLRAVKSSNVNIWVVTQRLNIYKGYFNLKYGVGLEMFNLRYESNINYDKDAKPYIFRDSINFSKNKLYAGYATVPFMFNFNSSPGRKGLIISAGISAGYLIGSHDKQKSNERGKQKTHGNLGLEQFRLAYVGELGIGGVRLFGSYGITKLHERSLEQFPFSMGIRFSNF